MVVVCVAGATRSTSTPPLPVGGVPLEQDALAPAGVAFPWRQQAGAAACALVSWANEPCNVVQGFLGSSHGSGSDCDSLSVSDHSVSDLDDMVVESVAATVMAVAAAVTHTNRVAMHSGDLLTAVES